MEIGEFAGYVASSLVFMTFYMKKMVWLRIVGILSNIAFISYGSIEGLVPIFILHSLLLPLNLFRLLQIQTRTTALRERWKDEPSLEALLPFMTQSRLKMGEVLFDKNDIANEMFFVLEGVVRLEEIDMTFGKGELLGVLNIFSPSKKRTATAICETDVKLLRVSADKVLQLCGENPKFGFYMTQLIAGRLSESQTATEESLRTPGAQRPVSNEHVSVVDPSHMVGDTRPPQYPSAKQIRPIRIATAPYFVGAMLMAVGFVIYAGWSAGRSVESVLFRDAAVTTWIHVARSPIGGILDGPMLKPGQRVDANGRIAKVRNHQADPIKAERAAAELARADVKVNEIDAHLIRLKHVYAELQARSDGYAGKLNKDPGIEIDDAKRELAVIDEKLKPKGDLANPKTSLAITGRTSQSDADEAIAKEKALQHLPTEHGRTIERAQERLHAADQDVFLASAGREQEGTHKSRDELGPEIIRTTRALAEAKEGLAKTQTASATARDLHEQTSASPVFAPSGSIVWSAIAGEGEAVEVGTKVAEWIDCNVMLVDVVASDVEIELLRKGMPAVVVFEGESKERKGTVLMTHGPSSILGDDVLAAVAKGHGARSGQAILSLEFMPEESRDCPVGRTAAVDFPEIGVLDRVRAYMRL